MSTKKPIVSVVLSDEELEAIRDYQFGNRVKSQSKAIVELILRGLEEELPGKLEKKAPVDEITGRQKYMLYQYEKADEKTKAAVDILLNMGRFEKEKALEA